MKLDIYHYIDDWANNPLCMQKSFNELFTIDGFPLEFFYNRSFRKYLIPSQINPYKFLDKGKRIDFISTTKFALFSKVLAQYLRSKELRKIKHIKNVKKEKSKESNKKKVLFLTFPHHVSDDNKIFRIEGIVQKTEKDPTLQKFVLFVDPLSRNEYKRVLEKNVLYSYYDDNVNTKAKNISQKLSAQWKRISEKTKHDFLTSGDTSYWPFYKHTFNLYLSQDFLYVVALYYEMYTKVLIDENIKAVVLTGSSSIVERCLLAAAEKMNIPTIVIAHGLGKKSKNKNLMKSTKIAVFSDAEKEGYIKNGNKNDIRVVGPVVYDDIAQYISEKKSTCKRVLIAIDSKVDGGSATKENYFPRIERILREIKKMSNVQIDLKLHPKNTLYETYNKLIENNGFTNVRVFKPNISRNDFYQLIKECDIFMHFGSNAALEAMIIGRPVITIDLLYKGREHWIKNNDVTVEVAYTGDIKEAIEKAIQEQDILKQRMKETVIEHCGVVDGNAQERVVNLIHEVIGEKEKRKEETKQEEVLV